ncbi:hypothetical protein JCM19233_4201 [Vibrio astriarenae]|nr:hypothetical protein JCM19233_4201 [Vibrio sp. C7]
MIEEEGQDEFDRQQRNMLGRLILVFGALVMAMVLIPNPFWDVWPLFSVVVLFSLLVLFFLRVREYHNRYELKLKVNSI